MKLADKNAGNVQVPVGYGWSPGPGFAKYSYMKSHDWKQVCFSVLFLHNDQSASDLNVRFLLNNVPV